MLKASLAVASMLMLGITTVGLPNPAQAQKFGPCASNPFPKGELRYLRPLPIPSGLVRMLVALPSPNPTGNDFSSQVQETRALWPNGTTIKIGFLGGTPQEKAMVKTVAVEWLQYAKGLNFVFVEGNAVNNSHVMITFDANNGSWSYVGTHSLRRPYPQPTMNFGWLSDPQTSEAYKKGTILHEFGHMLGLHHEHQNANSTIRFNREKVLSYYRNEHGWDEDKIYYNILKHYSINDPIMRSTNYDPDSIMLYYFPAFLTEDNMGTKVNVQLSNLDKAWANICYPANPVPTDSQREAYWKMTDKFTGSDVNPQWNWSVAIEGAGTQSIEKVVYTLHPTFKNRVVESKDKGNGFVLSANGYGTFVIEADVYWSGETKPVHTLIPLRFLNVPSGKKVPVKGE